MKAIRSPVSSVIRGRALATRVATQQSERKVNPTSQDTKVSRLPGGVIVISLETYAPVSNLAVVYNAGPRNESSSELGLTHCLRSAINHSSQRATAFGIAKNLQQIGSSLTCTTTREQMIYSVQCLRTNLSKSLEFLNQVATAPVFKPWELADAQPRLKLDLELYSKSLDARLMDAVHKAAYRDSLGQPLYMNADRVGSFTPQALEAFVDKHYVSHNAVVLGVGVDHDALQHAARKLSVRPGPAPTPSKTKFHPGGEVRVDAPSRLVHAAVVYEGMSLSSADLLSLSVLQYILGDSSPVQYGLNASSKLLKAGLSVTNQPFTANCFSVNYTDSGLFGIYAVADMFDIGKVLRAAVNVMGQAVKTGFTDAEVQRAKARVKAGIQLTAEESSTLIESLTTQALYTNEPLTPKQLAALVDKVKTDDVNRVARQVTSCSPAMGAVGNLVNSPHLDELL